jgi:hypothetical protein
MTGPKTLFHQDLKRRIRKIPGVPIMCLPASCRPFLPKRMPAFYSHATLSLRYISERRFSIERLPEAYGGNFHLNLVFAASPRML